MNIYRRGIDECAWFHVACTKINIWGCFTWRCFHNVRTFYLILFCAIESFLEIENTQHFTKYQHHKYQTTNCVFTTVTETSSNFLSLESTSLLIFYPRRNFFNRSSNFTQNRKRKCFFFVETNSHDFILLLSKELRAEKLCLKKAS